MVLMSFGCLAEKKEKEKEKERGGEHYSYFGITAIL